MEISLLKGRFTSNELEELVEKMIQMKISFHENRIQLLLNEEDIKAREKRIIELQQNLHDARKMLKEKQGTSYDMDVKISL